MKVYKIAVIGFGSIGKRHLNNIYDVLTSKNISFTIDLIRRSNSNTIDGITLKLINNVYTSYEDIPNDYDIIFIANPTNLHYQTIKKYIHKTKHMFIEKPVFDDSKLSVDDLKIKENAIYYVACPLRYTDVIQYIKNNVDISTILNVRVICSSYLPDWRANVDYRSTYSARKSEGGGVSLDLIHEWDYIQYLFGLPKKVYNLKGRFSELEIDCEDLSVYIAEYDKMLIELHLDYFGRKAIREVQIITKDDTIIADLINSKIRYLCNGNEISFKETRNDFQIKEIEYFFDLIEGKVLNHNNLDMAVQTLKIAKDGII